jgi:acyl-CoA reductase-like NAD-dependent aldehyde dehydrogenase
MKNGRKRPNGRNGDTQTMGRRASRSSRAPRISLEPSDDARLKILKTYKIYVGGKFPRTESGRYYLLRSPAGEALANIAQCSRKDFRDAVVAARSAQSSWGSRAAYNRGQILYRIAEMLEGRSAQFVDEMVQMGAEPQAARAEITASIDRFVYYAGWCDKYQQIFSSVNPVSSSHFNFSVLEPTGVVSIIAPEDSALIGLVSTIAPVIAGGNTCIALASTSMPLCAVTLGEVLATSDLPGGVINLLTGDRSELHEHFASHMDVNATVYCGRDMKHLAAMSNAASLNVKRVVHYDREDWMSDEAQGPYLILDTQEVKTTWHPVGI